MFPLGKVQNFDYFHCCVCAGVHEAGLLVSLSPTLDPAKTSRWMTRKTSAGSHLRERRAVGERDPECDGGKPYSKHDEGGKEDRIAQAAFLIG